MRAGDLGRRVLLPVLACLLSVLTFWLLYRYDNKYTARQPAGMGGTLLLDEAALEEHPVLFLVDGWAYYGGRLLTPEDLASAGAPSPDAYIYIGQYGGFDAGDPSAQPHGSASYRLTIGLPEGRRIYTLELPEIFSAYHIYINGMSCPGMGDPDPDAYRAEMGSRSITFEAEGRADILIAVTDHSYLYSGMVYPPAFGQPQAVATLLDARLLLRGAFCAAAATIGLLSLLIGLHNRRGRVATWYGLLCLLFLGYAGYPLWLRFAGGARWSYAIENISFCVMLLVVMLIRSKLAGRDALAPVRDRWFLLFGGAVSLAALAVHIALPLGMLWMMVAFSRLVMAYEWVTAAYLTASALLALSRENRRRPELLCGSLIFDCALVMDRLLPAYEPIVGGWFIELAGFALILSMGVSIARESAGQYRQNAVLEERIGEAERLLNVQRSYYAAVTEQMEEVKALQHDQRHHFLVLTGLVREGRCDEAEAYLREYGGAIPDGRPLRYCAHEAVNLLAYTYSRLAHQQGIAFELDLDVAADLPIPSADLTTVLGNLLENGLEACRRLEGGERTIRLSVRQTEHMLAIRQMNSATEGAERRGKGFLSSKAADRCGYGLSTVEMMAEKYDGEAWFRFDGEEGMFESTVILNF